MIDLLIIDYKLYINDYKLYMIFICNFKIILKLNVVTVTRCT